MKPVIKWVGGKRQLLAKIFENIPQDIEKYYEPFLGGGAIFIELMNRYKNGEFSLLKEVHLNDKNSTLINLYTCIRNNPKDVLNEVNKLCDEYNSAPDPETYYYDLRKKFNKQRFDFADGHTNVSLSLAATFILINKTCYNGMYRENSKGEFNTPWNKKSYVTIDEVCSSKNLFELSEALNGFGGKIEVHITNSDYEMSLNGTDSGTFVYMDPPYFPISTTSGFVGYTSEGFDTSCQEHLAEVCKNIDKTNSKFLLSNSAPNDNTIEYLYESFNIDYVKAKRRINCNSKKRGDVMEVLVKNF